MNYNQKVGQFGEELVKNYLIKHGYKIIDSNIKASYKEIDIIVKFKNILVFIEVKTRTSTKFGKADENFSRRKIQNIKQAIKLYLNKNKINYSETRLDLISVDINKDKKIAKIKQYKDVF